MSRYFFRTCASVHCRSRLLYLRRSHTHADNNNNKKTQHISYAFCVQRTRIQTKKHARYTEVLCYTRAAPFSRAMRRTSLIILHGTICISRTLTRIRVWLVCLGLIVHVFPVCARPQAAAHMTGESGYTTHPPPPEHTPSRHRNVVNVIAVCASEGIAIHIDEMFGYLNHVLAMVAFTEAVRSIARLVSSTTLAYY